MFAQWLKPEWSTRTLCFWFSSLALFPVAHSRDVCRPVKASWNFFLPFFISLVSFLSGSSWNYRVCTAGMLSCFFWGTVLSIVTGLLQNHLIVLRASYCSRICIPLHCLSLFSSATLSICSSINNDRMCSLQAEPYNGLISIYFLKLQSCCINQGTPWHPCDNPFNLLFNLMKQHRKNKNLS